MTKTELTDLLVSSSENINQCKFIPWWVEDYENYTYHYYILDKETVQKADSCAAEYGTNELLSPVGSWGLTLFHLLVLHNFYSAVEKMLCDGRINEADVNTPDHRGHGLTPFLLACFQGNLAMVRLLLNHGADDSVSDKRGRNAYHFLTCPRLEGQMLYRTPGLEHSPEQRAEIARLLTCDINRKNADGFTPLEQMLSVECSAKYTWPLAEIFLEKGAETGSVDEKGNTLLMTALQNYHKTAAFRLIQHCPEMINTENNEGITPIRHALSYREDALCFVLREYGAESEEDNPTDMDGISEIAYNALGSIYDGNWDGLDLALYITEKAIRLADPDDDDEAEKVAELLPRALSVDKHARGLKLCRDAGFDFTQPFYCGNQVLCLRDECLDVSYRTDILRKLLALGVDMDKAVIKGRTPANILASDDREYDREHEAFYEEAAGLFSKASMEETDHTGKAAVHLAAKNGHIGMLKVMVEKGVDINLTEDKPGETGVTPLHLACLHGHVDVVKLLIAAGADDTILNGTNETPAHLILMKSIRGNELEPEQRAALLKELKNIDIPGEDGQTPLMLLRHTTKELLPILLDKGADVNHADHVGRTALMQIMDKDIIKELIRAGAQINVADNTGNTALHYALENGALEEARFLIKKGADYNRPNNKGKTPAQLAAEKGFDTVLDLMTDIM